MLLEDDFIKASSYRLDIEDLELQLGHTPSFDEE